MAAEGPRVSRLPLAVVYPDNLAALAVCRSLGERGVPVAVVSENRTAPAQYSRHARRVASPRSGDGLALVDTLVKLARSEAEPPVLFLTDDASIVAVHQHRAALEPHYRFPMSPWPVLSRIMMKDQLYQSLEGVVPVPRTRVPADASELEDVARELGFPVLLKPRLRCLGEETEPSAVPFERCFGSKAIRASTFDELAAAYGAARARGFALVIQEEIEGPSSALVSLGLYATRQGTVPAAFTSRKLRQVPADFGDGLVVEATQAPELIALGERIVRHFGYFGIADIEFKWEPRTGVYKVLDINPRPWLWMNLPTACGVNLAYAAYLDAVGRPVEAADFVQRDYRTRWVSVRGLLVHLVRSIRAKQPLEGLRTLVGQFGGRRVGPLWSADDLLVRMFANPAFWRDSLVEAATRLKQLRMAQQER